MTGYVPSSEVFKNVDRSRYPYIRVSDAEFKRRHQVIRSFMEKKGLDCLLIAGGSSSGDRAWTNIRWVTNHVGCEITSYAYVVFSAKGEITVLTLPMQAEMPCKRARPVVEDVRSGWNFGPMVVARIRELGASSGKIGIVDIDILASIPVNHYKVFTQELPQAQFEIVTRDWWHQVRRIKSDEEIEFLEKAAEIGDKMIEAIVQNVRPGMNEADIFAWMSYAMIKNGGEIPAMVLATSTNTFDPDSSFQGVTPRNRVLQPGDIILTEVGPRYPDGSECQTGKPIAFGEPSQEYRKMVDIMLRAYDRVVDQLRPGKTDQDIARAGSVIREAGYVWHSPLIHSELGGGVSATPVVFGHDDAFIPQESFVMEPNMTIVPEIHVASPDWTRGVFMCDTWVITPGEPRCLNKYPRQLTII